MGKCFGKINQDVCSTEFTPSRLYRNEPYSGVGQDVAGIKIVLHVTDYPRLIGVFGAGTDHVPARVRGSTEFMGRPINQTKPA